MTSISQNNRKDNLLDSAARRGYDRAMVEQCLTDGVVFGQTQPDARGNRHYAVTVLRTDLDRACKIQFRIGKDGNQAGCATCTSEAITNGRYKPHLVEDCPAVAAAQIAWILDQPSGLSDSDKPDNHNTQPEAPNGNLLELALAEFQARTQWDSVEAVPVWESGDYAAWLSRNSQGFICLTLFRDHERLTKRKYSKPLAIGYFSPQDSMWVESPNLREDYPRWSEQARRAVQ